MKLIDIYIQEVTRRLPEKNRQDIALELRSTIEDMLPPEGYTEEEVKKVLTKLGNPAALANGYRDSKPYLIGPRYFEVYKTILKMILPILTIIVFISFIAGEVIHFNGDEAIVNLLFTIFGEGIVVVLNVWMQVFFWTTLSFAIVERVDSSKDQEPLTMNMKKWTPDDLKNIEYLPEKRRISKFEVYSGLFWTAVWATVYFYADHLIGAYESGSNGLVFVTPIFNQQVLQTYWPAVIAILVGEVLLSLYKLFTGKWTIKMSWANLVLQFVCTVVFIVIVNNSNLFDPGFIRYINQVLDFNTGWEGTMKGWATALFILGAAYNTFDGFRRAKR